MAGNADYIRREKAIIEAKLNRSYLDPINLPHLDDNTLKYHMMSFLKMIVKTKGKMATTHPFNNLNFFDKDNFQSFYINKILFEHTYILSVDLVNHTDLFHMRDILNEYKRGNRFRFWLWRRKNRMYEFKKK